MPFVGRLPEPDFGLISYSPADRHAEPPIGMPSFERECAVDTVQNSMLRVVGLDCPGIRSWEMRGSTCNALYTVILYVLCPRTTTIVHTDADCLLHTEKKVIEYKALTAVDHFATATHVVQPD